MTNFKLFPFFGKRLIFHRNFYLQVGALSFAERFQKGSICNIQLFRLILWRILYGNTIGGTTVFEDIPWISHPYSGLRSSGVWQSRIIRQVQSSVNWGRIRKCGCLAKTSNRERFTSRSVWDSRTNPSSVYRFIWRNMK